SFACNLDGDWERIGRSQILDNGKPQVADKQLILSGPITGGHDSTLRNIRLPSRRLISVRAGLPHQRLWSPEGSLSPCGLQPALSGLLTEHHARLLAPDCYRLAIGQLKFVSIALLHLQLLRERNRRCHDRNSL